MITSKITNVTLHLDPFVWSLGFGHIRVYNNYYNYQFTLSLLKKILCICCWKMAEFNQTGLFIYFSKIIEFTTFKVVKSLTPFSQKKKILSINLFQAWGESIDWSVFDWLIRTTLLVLPLGWKRQMQGKLKAFISNTMNTMLELLTRGNRLTGIYIYSNDCFLFSIFSVIRYRL